MYEAMDYVDNIVLRDYLGFDDFILTGVRSAWEQLRDRRIHRNGRSAESLSIPLHDQMV